jgi:hypothetical protein
MAYATLAALKADLGISDTNDDTALQLVLDAATRYIDLHTGRSFAAEVGAIKYFYATSPNELILSPDATSITEVKVDSNGTLTYPTTLVANTNYYTHPLQSTPDAGIISALRILPTSSTGFAPGYRVKVTGNWGYTVGGEAPANIVLACLRQAARYWKRRDSPLGVLQSVDLGQFTRLGAEDPDVIGLIQPYKAAGQAPSWLLV